MIFFCIGIFYLLYSGIVDIIISKRLLIMKQNELPLPGDNVIIDYNCLLKSINNNSKIVENIKDRKIWNYLVKLTSQPKLLDGKYEFLYRNYVNFEEKYAICKRLKTIHFLIFHMDEIGKIEINNNNVIMTDNFIMFGCIKITIKWFGELNHNKNEIKWNKTVLIHQFGMKENPKISEQLRQVPWRITHKLNNIFVFNTNPQKYISYKKIT